jgi:hypothetical protein
MLIILIKVLNENVEVYLCNLKLFSMFGAEPILRGKFIIDMLPTINMDVK